MWPCPTLLESFILVAVKCAHAPRPPYKLCHRPIMRDSQKGCRSCPTLWTKDYKDLAPLSCKPPCNGLRMIPFLSLHAYRPPDPCLAEIFHLMPLPQNALCRGAVLIRGVGAAAATRQLRHRGGRGDATSKQLRIRGWGRRAASQQLPGKRSRDSRQ